MQEKILDVCIQKELKGFSLDVQFHAGQGCLGILGPSGCGKSLTLKSIAGIFTPQKGHIVYEQEIFFDSSIKKDMKPQKRKVGYLFQDYALFPNMTVKQNIECGKSSKNTQELIEQFHLKGLENHYPSQLSGGQKQRVALARIFAYQPHILLLDEPFSAMDSFLKERLQLDLIKTLKSYDGISILVSHNRDEIYQLCDHVIVMNEGKVIDSGKTKNVFAHPKNIISARLTGCKNISMIKKIDDHHVEALDWHHLILRVEEKITDDIKAIGIRAHDFIPMEEINKEENCILVSKYEISEMPFEWYMTLDNGLWWKCEKDMNDHDPLKVIPHYLYINPKSILLLKE